MTFAQNDKKPERGRCDAPARSLTHESEYGMSASPARERPPQVCGAFGGMVPTYLESLPRLGQLEKIPFGLAYLATSSNDGPLRLDLEARERVTRPVNRHLEPGEVYLARLRDQARGGSVTGIQLYRGGAQRAPQGLVQAEGLVVSYSALEGKLDLGKDRIR